MSNIIILSIKKEHADNILSGKKIYEFRKSKPKKDNLPYLVLLYEAQRVDAHIYGLFGGD